MKNGVLIVLSGPSGVGKNTVLNEILKKDKDMVMSISATTRKPRGKEQDGINYHFKSKNEFEEMIKNDELLEFAKTYGNYYGTMRTTVIDNLNNGKDVVLEIDPVGAMQVKEHYSEALMIFILPPSLNVLKERLKGRATESEEMLEKRFSCAKEEMEMASNYDHQIINDNIEKCAEEIINIIESKRSKVC